MNPDSRQEWTQIAGRLPKSEEPVLFIARGRTCIGLFRGRSEEDSYFEDYEGRRYRLADVTKWKPTGHTHDEWVGLCRKISKLRQELRELSRRHDTVETDKLSNEVQARIAEVERAPDPRRQY